MSKRKQTQKIDLETAKKWLTPIFTAIGQLPGVATSTGLYSISLYQPSIYHGKELFLIVPLMVGVLSAWLVLRWQNAMWLVVVMFFVTIGLVYWIYTSYGPLSPIHPINWILSYCAFALFMAALARLALDAISHFQQT